MTEVMLRYNTGKPKLFYLPSSFWRVLLSGRSGDRLNLRMVFDIAAISEFGAVKYAKDNWRRGGSWCEVAASGQRHLAAYICGETHCPESKLPHLAHLGWNIMALIEFQEHRYGVDDRYLRPNAHHRPALKAEQASPRLIMDLITRWLESECDEYIVGALMLLNEFYNTMEIETNEAD